MTVRNQVEAGTSSGWGKDVEALLWRYGFTAAEIERVFIYIRKNGTVECCPFVGLLIHRNEIEALLPSQFDDRDDEFVWTISGDCGCEGVCS